MLNVRKGEFGFIDSSGAKMAGTQKFECEVTVRAGQVVYDLRRDFDVEPAELRRPFGFYLDRFPVRVEAS